jgi:hypothetical protein
MAYYVGKLLITVRPNDQAGTHTHNYYNVRIYDRSQPSRRHVHGRLVWKGSPGVPLYGRNFSERRHRYEAARTALSFAVNDKPEIEDLIEGWYDREGNVILEPGRA